MFQILIFNCSTLCVSTYLNIFFCDTFLAMKDNFLLFSLSKYKDSLGPEYLVIVLGCLLSCTSFIPFWLKLKFSNQTECRHDFDVVDTDSIFYSNVGMIAISSYMLLESLFGETATALPLCVWLPRFVVIMALLITSLVFHNQANENLQNKMVLLVGCFYCRRHCSKHMEYLARR